MATEFLTAEQLAERLRLTPETIRRWARGKRIPSVRITPKVIRFNWEEVARALSTTSKVVPSRRRP